MITLHHLQVSQSERITWLLEELSLPYTLVTHVRDPLTSPASLKAVPGNLLGKSPFIHDSATGAQLTESLAIVEYILQTYGGDGGSSGGGLLVKPGAANYAAYLQWFHFANATLQPDMVANMFLAGSGAAADAMTVRFARGRLDDEYRVMDERLGRSRFLAGDEFTAADLVSVFPLTTQRLFGPQDDLSGYANILRWLKECTARPAYRAAMQKADPDLKLVVDGPAPPNLMAAGGVVSDVWKK